MAATTAQPSSSPATKSEKRDFRQEVTDQIINMLENGVAPWQKPWEPGRAGFGMPMNPTTEKAYRGGNAIHLMATALRKHYDDPRWMTYKQASDHGWQVRKGEKGTQIEFWEFKPYAPQREGDPQPDGETGETEGSHSQDRRYRYIHRVYTVFNAKQIEGIPVQKPKEHTAFEAAQAGEQILKNSGAQISHDQADRAFYNRAADSIHLPPKNAFKEAAGYYGTALHELAHWSGHPERLNRQTLNQSYRFGDANYAKEELRAELASVFLAAERGIPHDPEQHAAYVGSWIKALKEDKNEIFRAAHDASAATDFLLALERDRSIVDETLAAGPVMDSASNVGTREAAYEEEAANLLRDREDLDENVPAQRSKAADQAPGYQSSSPFKPGDKVMAYEPYYYGGKPRPDPWVPAIVHSLYHNDEFISYVRDSTFNGNKAVEYAANGDMRHATPKDLERYARELSKLEKKLPLEFQQQTEKSGTPDSEALRESIQTAARYEPGSATVNVEDKQTGTQRRSTVEMPPGSAQNANERQPAGKDELNSARAITTNTLGESARTVEALADSGNYRGVIIGETECYLVQRQSAGMAILHQKDLLDRQPQVGEAFSINYSKGKGFVRDTRDRAKAHELGR